MLCLISKRLVFTPAPENPVLHPGEVHVWRLELNDPRPPRASRWELREVLARYLGEEPKAIELTEDSRGKPRLAKGSPTLRFNLSHSEALALVVLSGDREVGVDVERIRLERDFVALAERALEDPDVAAVREASEADRAATFYERWTRHEARLKCLGLGLSTPPPQDPPTIAVETLAIDPGYAAAVAAVGPQPFQLHCWTFGPPLRKAE